MNEHVKPYSLFTDQLAKRLGRDVSDQCRVLERDLNASSSPTIEEANKMAEEALKPRQTLQQWIEAARLDIESTTPTKPFTSHSSLITSINRSAENVRNASRSTSQYVNVAHGQTTSSTVLTYS